MNKFAFKKLVDDLTRRIEVEGKKNPSWLMGYLQGKGSEKLTGYQCSVLVDLLLVPLETNIKCQYPVNVPVAPAAPEVPEEHPEPAAPRNIYETLAQR